ncbi:glutamate 5-kinase [Oleiphilus sp. HI0071]|nr:glutamate 5-kinase [Oleiphilus sp. HI0065]KZY87829.1 glutamate 5-kinase [Oleiphilus sp. HI0071]KZY89254.1 glutamate 5-kinase [Oleiphilus sp. HI0073]KZZ51247.1 glutamate 5-kinase [Oleiphilus sp. HI0122]KZZ52528.1 glutamate 5-kinase [Oleiphilus sp. HI0118]KZZ81438.1 glutamate 5-kinase [Oleiphilus sp. HI0133]
MSQLNKNETRDKLRSAKRIVVKIGSALLTDDGRGLAHDSIQEWVTQMVSALDHGVEIVLVSSGSVAEGMVRLGLESRPSQLNLLQAAAAVGQTGLVNAYERYFGEHQRCTAQILLTHDDLSDRKRYLNARSTITTLLDLGAVPIINENDTVVTDEIRFGDNDTLGALVTNLVDADGLIILTDQDGMFDRDPRKHSDARLLSEVRADDENLDAMAGGVSGALGRGGMQTKLRAARLAARSGAFTVVAGGKIPNVLTRLFEGESVGTLFRASTDRQLARKQWLAGHLQTKGDVVLDGGAVKALRAGGKSLLPVGVVSVLGRFRRGEMVRCLDQHGDELARGLINYNAEDAKRIAGLASSEISERLGYCHEPELIHCDNLVLT